MALRLFVRLMVQRCSGHFPRRSFRARLTPVLKLLNGLLGFAPGSKDANGFIFKAI